MTKSSGLVNWLRIAARWVASVPMAAQRPAGGVGALGEAVGQDDEVVRLGELAADRRELGRVRADGVAAPGLERCGVVLHPLLEDGREARVVGGEGGGRARPGGGA